MLQCVLVLNSFLFPRSIPLYAYTTFLINPFIASWMFVVLPLLGYCAVHISVQSLVWTHIPFLLGLCSGVELLAHVVGSCLTSSGAPDCFPKVQRYSAFLLVTRERSSFSTSSPYYLSV